jgi:DNA-binding response OmpR family regulator
MASILLVVRPPAVADLHAALQGKHQVELADSLAQARVALHRRSWDAIILDADQSDGDGVAFVAELRAGRQTACLPILVVTGRGDLAAKLLGFAVGCDDWLPLEVHPLELQARLGVHLRKQQEHADIALHGLHIDLNCQRAWTVSDDGVQHALPLTALELKLLVHFAHHVDHVIDRDHLLAAVWGQDLSVLDRTVDTHVCHLRRKLASSPWTIEAVTRLGYRFGGRGADAVG